MPLPERIAAIAFDLDGTLIDSAPDIAHALEVALREEHLHSYDLATVRGWIGDGPDALIDRALTRQGKADANPALRARLRAAFDAATLSAPLEQGAVYDGIPVMLSRLAEILPLAVVTNKPSQLSRAVLSAAGLLSHFSAVHGADRLEQRKPAPALLTAAALGLGVERHHLLMVGDSPADLQAAKAAGCAAALVSWGYGASHVPADSAVWRIADPGELLAGLQARRINT